MCITLKAKKKSYSSADITYNTKRVNEDKIVLTSTDYCCGTIEIAFERKK